MSIRYRVLANRLVVAIMMAVTCTGALWATGSPEQSAIGADSNVTPAGTLPIVQQPITLDLYATVAEWIILEDNELVQWLDDQTNIQLNFEVTASNNAQEKINLLLASQANLPDVFWDYNDISPEQRAVYGSQGLFADLRDYWDYLPNMQKIEAVDPSAIKSITSPDGGVYSFLWKHVCEHCRNSQRFWINQSWLDNLGLDMPTTPEELFDVLVQFRDQDANGNGDPNDEVPLFALSAGWRAELVGFLMNPFTFTPLQFDGFRYVESGEVKSSVLQPGFKEGMKFLARLYANDLLDPEFVSAQRAQARALTGNPRGNQLGSIPSGGLGPFVNIGVEGPRSDFAAVPPLTGPTGLQQTPYFAEYPVPKYSVVTTSDHVLAALRFADFMLTDRSESFETWATIQYGPNGWRHVDDPQGNRSVFGLKAIFEQTFPWAQPQNLMLGNMPPKFPLDDVDDKSFMYGGAASETGAFDQERILWEVRTNLYAPHSVDKSLPPISIDPDRSTDYSEFQTASTQYIGENIAKFIIGERDIDSEWDLFLAELDRLGFGEYLEITQAAYDAAYK